MFELVFNNTMALLGLSDTPDFFSMACTLGATTDAAQWIDRTLSLRIGQQTQGVIS